MRSVLILALAALALCLLLFPWVTEGDAPPRADSTPSMELVPPPGGRTQQPRSAGPPSVAAEADVGGRRSVQEKRLAADIEPVLHVRVLDPDERPVAGVLVGLTVLDDVSDRYTHDAQPTDEDGWVNFDEDTLENYSAVLIDLPTAAPIHAPFDGRDLPQEVLLRVPRLGRIKVDIVLEEGAAADVEPMLFLSSERAPGVTLFSSTPGFDLAYPLDLAYGLELLQLGEWRPVSELHPALSSNEPFRAHRIVLRQRFPVLVGRLLLPSGNPPERLGYVWIQAGEEYMNHSTNLRHDGRFRVPVQLPWAPDSSRTAHFFHSSDGEFRDVEASVNLAFELPDTEIDLGFVQLEPRPVLVAGRIEFDDGRAPQFADFQIYQRPGGRETWSALGSARMSGKSGRFSVFETTEPDTEYAIHCFSSHWVQQTAGWFEPGERALQIVLGPAAKLRGTVSLPELRRSWELEVAPSFQPGVWYAPALELEATPRSLRFRAGRGPGKAHFRAQGLPPGVANIRIRPRHGLPIGEVRRVALRSEEEADIGELDLRGLVFEFALRVEDALGNPVREVEVLYREDSGMGFEAKATRTRRTDWWILTTASEVDVLVRAPGHSPRVFRAVSSDRVLRIGDSE